MRRVVVTAAVLGAISIGSTGYPQSGGRNPDPCSLLTKAEIQKATGRTNVMRVANQPDVLSGKPVCTVDGGGVDIELIVYPRTATTPLGIPKGAEAVSGVGAGAYFMSTPGNAEVFAIKSLTSKYALHVGL